MDSSPNLTEEEIKYWMDEYPELEREDIEFVLEYYHTDEAS